MAKVLSQRCAPLQILVSRRIDKVLEKRQAIAAAEQHKLVLVAKAHRVDLARERRVLCACECACI